MRRQPFVPARNSRHRTAALSLYRALLRCSSKVDLPQDVHPAPAIRKAFARNRAYTSHRLVYASMAAGYKFLTLCSEAQSGSPQHSELVAHLRSRRDVARPERKAGELSTREPFLKRVSAPGAAPVYKATYVPYTFKFRVPSVCSTADGQPFLRLKKPQPTSLSRMVGRKGGIFADKIRNLIEAEELGWDAAQEDKWDDLVARQMRLEGVRDIDDDSLQSGRDGKMSTTSFAWSVRLTRLWWEWQVENTWGDWVARGEALNQLVEEQRGDLRLGNGMQVKGLSKAKSDGKKRVLRGQDSPNVGVYAAPSQPLTASISAAIRQQGVGQGETVDPFLGPAWSALVTAQSGRLSKWAGKGAVDGERSDTS